MKSINFTFGFLVLLLVGFTSANAQIANIPYSCNFEDPTENARWVKSSLITNQWVFGTATYSSPTRSAYISNDNGTTATYTSTLPNQGTVPMYREFNTVAGEEYRITFNWKAQGESSNDDLRVYWVDSPSVDISTWATSTNTVPTGSTAYLKAIMQGKTNFEECSFMVTGTGSPAKLVFLWRNNNNNTYAPGGCVDDIIVAKQCMTLPTHIGFDTDQYSYAKISWSGTGDSYDVQYRDISVSTTTPWTIVYNKTPPDTTLNISPFSSSGKYEIQVRAHCNGGVSLWKTVTYEVAGSIWVNEDSPQKNYTPEELLKKVFIKGGDCTVTNVTFSGLGWDQPTKTWTSTTQRSLTYFSHGSPKLGIKEGLLMTTGNAYEAKGPNTTTDIGGGAAITDPDLSALATSSITTGSKLEFDFIPHTDIITFDYVFASEEYPVYSCAVYNDVFGFFISGPGITGKKNIALLPGSNTPVAINNVNDQYCGSANAQYYVNGANNKYTEFNGHTTMLSTVSQTVIPGQQYHMKLSIANVYDSALGSGVFLRAGSLDLGLGMVNHGSMIDAMFNVFEGCEENKFTLKLNPLPDPIYVTLSYSGTAINDIVAPDGTPLPTTILIPAGTSEYDIYYKVNSPVTENGGSFTITVQYQFCPGMGGTDYTIYVYEKVKNPEFHIYPNCDTNNGTVSVSLTEGTQNVQLSIDNQNVWHLVQGFSTTLPSGNHTIHFKDSIGCGIESFQIVVPSVSAKTTPISKTICEGDTYYFKGANLSTPGTYKDTLQTMYGCDSIIVLNLNVTNSVYGVDTQVKFVSYTWIDGVTYTESTNTPTYTIVGGSKAGCDSIVTLNLTINHTATGTDTQVACDSYTWINGVTYTSSNYTDTYTLVNGSILYGCDSVVTLNLTINYTIYSVDTKNECDSYTWINGVTYTESNYTDTHTIYGGSSKGCDSIVKLNLKLSYSVDQTIDATVCDDEVYVLNGVAYSQSGTYTAYMKTKNGCDSIVTLNLEAIENKVFIQVSDPICTNDGYFNLTLSQNSGAVMPTNYKLDFTEKAVPIGFSNFVNQQGTITSDVITVQMPENAYPNNYLCTLTLSNNANDCKELSYEIYYDVLYPTSIMEQKWNNVIALLNEDYNGGYKFTAYQWYRNTHLLPGETQSYLYLQYGNLVEGDLYSVLITREDGTKIQSCPFEAHAPKGEVSNTPTIVNGGDVIKISPQDKNTTVRLITVTGIILSTANSSGEIVAPMQQGVYILEILSGNNSVNVTKIIVK